MYTLYGSAGSGSAAIELALLRCDIEFLQVEAASWQPDSALSELARANPLQQIPTLVLPDGSVLTESAAILIHLGLVFPQAGLLPAMPLERAQAIRGLVYIAANCYSQISIVDYPERWIASDTAAAAQLRDGARAQLHRHWGLFADQFNAQSGQPFLNGELPGALDHLAAVVSKWSGTRAWLRQHKPDFHATLERIEADPAVAAVFARHWGAAA